jgi:hypothetical protein
LAHRAKGQDESHSDAKSNTPYSTTLAVETQQLEPAPLQSLFRRQTTCKALPRRARLREVRSALAHARQTFAHLEKQTEAIRCRARLPPRARTDLRPEVCESQRARSNFSHTPCRSPQPGLPRPAPRSL